MDDLLSYSLTDFLPFSHTTYLRLFELYNVRFWPVVVGGWVLGLWMLWLLHHPKPNHLRSALILLGACWLWVAAAFYIETYLPLNWAAGYAAAAFAVQGLLLAGSALAVAGPREETADRLHANRIGIGLLAIAVFGVPALGALLGRPWIGLEFFGSAPDPICLATFGVVLMLRCRFRALLMLIPVAWSVMSALTLLAMGDPRWPLLPVAAAAAVGTMVVQARSREAQ